MTEIRGSNYYITLNDSNQSAHIDKEELPGTLTEALVNR